LKKQVHHLKHKSAAKLVPEPVVESKSKVTKAIEKPLKPVQTKPIPPPPAKKQKVGTKDPFIEAEEAEIARLAKLLGVGKGTWFFNRLVCTILQLILLRQIQKKCC
jgi:hypothetical protein